MGNVNSVIDASVAKFSGQVLRCNNEKVKADKVDSLVAKLGAKLEATLTVLEVSHNRLKTMPTSLHKHLPRLRRLAITHNLLSAPEQNIGK